MDQTTIHGTTAGTSSEEKLSNGRWTKDEHQRFVEAIKIYGKNWKKVEDYIGTRTGAQIRSHAQKFFLRLEKDLKAKHSNQKDKGAAQQEASIRKLLEGSLSASQSQHDEISDNERQTDQLKENLSLHEAENQSKAAIISDYNSVVAPTRSSSLQEDSAFTNSQNLIQGIKTEKTPENTHDKSEKDSVNSKTHMLSKLQNGQEKSKQTNFLLDLLLQGSLNKFAQNLQPPVDTKSTAPAATTNRSSIADMVELSTEKSSTDDESYEIPASLKRIRQV